MSLNKGGGVGGGSVGVCKHTFPLCSGLCISVGGWGSTWLRLHPAGCAFCLGGLFMKAPARGCNLSGRNPQAQPCPDLALTWLPQVEHQEGQLLYDNPPFPAPPSRPPAEQQPLSWISATKLED